ncbi:MAG: glucosamine 6-phosphate synthetase, partial [Oscillospiraceae bacterium]
KELGLYVYASTTDILKKGLKSSGFKIQCNEVIVEEGNIIKIESNGEIWSSDFEMHETERFFSRWYNFDWYSDIEEDCFDELKSICGYYGVSEEEIDYMRSLGYTYDEIEVIEYETDC